MTKQIFLLDGSNLIHRSFFAMKDMASNSGFPTAAVYGFMMMMKNLHRYHKMRHFVLCLDAAGASKSRREIFPDYKANRVKEGPDLLGPQMLILKQVFSLLEFCTFGISGYEADDIIATLSRSMQEYFDEIVIVSGDKDLLALVSDKVFMLDTMKRIEYTISDVILKMGIPPNQITDYLALVGDAADNIPGCKGIGPAGACDLLKKYESIDAIYNNIDAVDKKYIKKLVSSKDNVMMSYKLASLNFNAPVEPSIYALIPRPTQDNVNKVRQLFSRLDFQEDTIDEMLSWISVK